MGKAVPKQEKAQLADFLPSVLTRGQSGEVQLWKKGGWRNERVCFLEEQLFFQAEFLHSPFLVYKFELHFAEESQKSLLQKQTVPSPSNRGKAREILNPNSLMPISVIILYFCMTLQISFHQPGLSAWHQPWWRDSWSAFQPVVWSLLLEPQVQTPGTTAFP